MSRKERREDPDAVPAEAGPEGCVQVGLGNPGSAQDVHVARAQTRRRELTRRPAGGLRDPRRPLRPHTRSGIPKYDHF